MASFLRSGESEHCSAAGLDREAFDLIGACSPTKISLVVPEKLSLDCGANGTGNPTVKPGGDRRKFKFPQSTSNRNLFTFNSLFGAMIARVFTSKQTARTFLPSRASHS